MCRGSNCQAPYFSSLLYFFWGCFLLLYNSSAILFTPYQRTWPSRHFLFSFILTPTEFPFNLRQLFSSYSQNIMACKVFMPRALLAFFLLLCTQLLGCTCSAASVSAIPAVEQEVIRFAMIDPLKSLLSDIFSVHNNRELSYGWPESEDVNSLQTCSTYRCMSMFSLKAVFPALT